MPCPFLSIALRGLGGIGLCLERRSVELLQLALLAVLPIPLAQPNFLNPSHAIILTHLPLGEAEFALAPSLGSDALVLLERAAHDARCDGNVAVVAVQQSMAGPNLGLQRRQRWAGVRETGGFPRECHCDGRMRVRGCGRGLGCGCRC